MFGIEAEEPFDVNNNSRSNKNDKTFAISQSTRSKSIKMYISKRILGKQILNKFSLFIHAKI